MSDKFNNKFAPSKIGKTKVSSGANDWVKNALKSLGYSSMDILSDVMPSTIDAVKSVGELSKEVVENVRDLKGHTQRMKTAMDKNAYFEIGRNLKNYALEDLRSGKFYNKERADSFGDDEDFDLDGFDIGGFDDFDSSSATSSDGSTSTKVTKASKDGKDVDIVQVNTNINGDNPMVSAVKEQTRVSYEGATLVADISKRNQLLTMQQLGEMNSQIGSQLGSMADNVGMITTLLGDTLSKHASLSAKYYEDSMGALTSVVTELKMISQQTKLSTANTTDMTSYKEYKNVIDTVFTSGGMVDVKEYINLIKTQFNKASDNNLMLSSLKGMVSQTDVFAEMAKNPLRFVSDSIVKKFIPSVVQSAAQKFDETFRETAIAGLYQIRNMGNSNNMLKELFGKTFGIGNAMKSSVDKSNYNKDAVSFDGISHRTLNDVIPFYLRRMTAMMEGGQEIAFDYDKGVYNTVKNITDGIEKERERRKLGGLGSVASDFSEYVGHTYKFKDPGQATELNKTFTKLLTNMVDRDGGINFKRIQNKDGSYRDDIADILDIRDSESPILSIIRGFFEGSENSYNLRTFGREALEARAGYDKYMRDVEANPLKYNENLMDTGVKSDTHIEYDKDNSSKFSRNAGGMFGVDKFGKDALYYMRETMTMIANGVGVFIMGGSTGKGRNQSFASNPNQSRVNELRNQKDDYDNKTTDKRSKPLDQERIESIQKKGDYTVVDANGIDSELSIDSKQAKALRQKQLQDEESNVEEKPTFLSKLVAIKPDSAFSKILSKFDKMTKDTSSKLEGYFTKANDALFELVFGSDETKSQKGGSFIKRTFDGLKLQFATFGNWMDKTILTPIYENLFGDNGVFTKLKNTQFAQDIKSMFKNMGDKLFGVEIDGNRSGGVLSSVLNELKDGGRNVLQFFTGKEYTDSKGQKHSAPENSVFGVFKGVASDISESFRSFIGVKKFDPSKSKTGSRFLDGVDTIWTTVKSRTNELMDDILGSPDSSQTRREFSKFSNEMSEGMPKIAASSIAGLGIGLIPSLFVPGGPIGGALIGGAMGIVSQSSKLKDALFGEEVDGERMGGLINKEVQSFFKDNKMGMGIGLSAGALAALGIIPSLFVPGGPIGGALIGGAISMANKSESLHKFLFGEDLDGNKIEGSISEKFHNMTGISLKDGFVNAGIGAGVGLIGSFFLPGGPIVGSLLGSAAGLALSSDKFKTYLFGDKDPKTGKREGGMFGAIGDWTKEHLFNPLGKTMKEAQINIMGFIKKEMVAPFAVAMIPIKEEFKRFKTRLFDGVNKFFTGFGERLNNSFDRYFGQPIGEFLETKVLNPLKGILSKIFGGIGKVVGSVISSPFKILNAMGEGLYKKHQKEGVEDLKDKSKNALFKGVDENGNKIGFKDRLKQGVQYLRPSQRKEARFSEKGAWYKDSYEGKLKEYRQKIDADIERKKMDLDHLYQNGNINDKAYRAQMRKLEAQKKANKAKTPKDTTTDTKPNVDSGTKPVSTPKETTKVEGNTGDKPTVAEGTGKSSSKMIAKLSSNITKPTKVSKGAKATASHYNKPITKPTPIETKGGVDKEPKVATSDSDDIGMSKAKAATAKSQGISKAKRDSLLVRMDKNLQIIADATKDQLDGVGRNVYRMRKMMQKSLGMSDDDVDGAANKDRKGFLGKLKSFFKNPLRFAKDLILTPFRAIGAGLTKAKDMIFGAVSGVVDVFVGVGKGLWNAAKGIGTAVLDILALPKLIGQMALEGLKMIGPAVGETLKQGVAFVGETLRTGVHMIGSGFKALGGVIYEGAKGFGQLIAGGMQGLGHLLAAAGVITKEAAVMIAKGVAKSAAFIGKGAMFALGGVKNMVGGALGWGMDKLFGKKDLDGKRSRSIQRVVVEGGFLDKIKTIGENSPIKGKLPDITSGGDTEKNTKIGTVDVSKEYGENADGVLTGLDLHSKSQEAKAEEKEKADKISDSRAQVVASGSFATKEAEQAIAEKEESEKSFSQRLLDGITNIGVTTKEHSSVWSSIFGKKGLVTGLLVMGLPMLWSAFKKFKEWLDNTTLPNIAKNMMDALNTQDEIGRTDAEGHYYESNALENRWTKLGITATAKTADFFTGNGGKVSKFLFGKFAKDPKAAMEFATSKGVNVLDEAGDVILTKQGKRGAAKAATAMNKKAHVEAIEQSIKGAGDKVTKFADNILDKAASNKIVSKFIETMDNWFKHVLDSTIVRKLLSSKAVDGCLKALKKVTSGLGDFILKSGSKFLHKIGMAVAEDGSMIFPPLGAIVKIIFGTSDFVTGMTVDAGKIFQVGKDDVTMGMRVVAGISKLIMGLSAIMDLGTEICYIMTDGVSLRTILAEVIYNTTLSMFGFLVGGKDDNLDRLKESQAEFRAEYEAYNKELKSKGKEEMTFVGYMDKEHESFFAKTSRKTKEFFGIDKKEEKTTTNTKPVQYGPSIPEQKSPKSYGSSKSTGYDNVMMDRGGEYYKPGDATSSDQHQGFAYYSQGDPRWGKKRYLPGGQDMKYGGCGPTSLAMVISQLTGQPVDPYSVAKEAIANRYVMSGGTTWEAMTKLPMKAGIPATFLGGGSSFRYNDSDKSDSVKTALMENKPVILSGNRRPGVSKSESPFTDGGHFVVAHATDGDGVVVNDPRSQEASKVYNFREVMKETKGAWVYPENQNSNYRPGSIGQQSPQGEDDPGLFGLFTGAIGAFLDPLKKKLFGSKAEDSTTSGTEYNSSETSSMYMGEDPKNLKEAMSLKTVELMKNNETGNNYAIAQNDKTGAGKPISPSVGVLQWRENNARELMSRMYKELPNSSDAKYYATKVDWNSRTPWSNKELQKYKKFMTDNSVVSKKVQDQFALEHVNNTIMPNVYKYAVDNGKLKDPRSIVMLSDISQTGPAHVTGLMTGKTASGNDYSHGTRAYNTNVPYGMSEFDHFNNEIRDTSTSYWGKYINTYRGRFDKSYKALKDWTPTYGSDIKTKAAPKALGVRPADKTQSYEMDKGGEGTNVTKCNFNADKGGYDNYVADNTVKTVTKIVNKQDNDKCLDVPLLQEAVGVLKEILLESKGTNKGIQLFNNKKFPQGNSSQIILENTNNMQETKYGVTGANKIASPKQEKKSIVGSPQYRLAQQLAMGMNT